MATNDYDAGWIAGYNNRTNASYSERYEAGYEAGKIDGKDWLDGYEDFINDEPMTKSIEYYNLGYNYAKTQYENGYNRARSGRSRKMLTSAYKLGYNAGLEKNYSDGYNDMYYQSLSPQRHDSKSYNNGYNNGYQDAWKCGYDHGLGGHESQSYNRAYLDGYNCGSLERNN
jgi:hypothetical protein